MPLFVFFGRVSHQIINGGVQKLNGVITVELLLFLTLSCHLHTTAATEHMPVSKLPNVGFNVRLSVCCQNASHLLPTPTSKFEIGVMFIQFYCTVGKCFFLPFDFLEFATSMLVSRFHLNSQFENKLMRITHTLCSGLGLFCENTYCIKNNLKEPLYCLMNNEFTVKAVGN